MDQENTKLNPCHPLLFCDLLAQGICEGNDFQLLTENFSSTSLKRTKLQLLMY